MEIGACGGLSRHWACLEPVAEHDQEYVGDEVVQFLHFLPQASQGGVSYSGVPITAPVGHVNDPFFAIPTDEVGVEGRKRSFAVVPAPCSFSCVLSGPDNRDYRGSGGHGQGSIRGGRGRTGSVIVCAALPAWLLGSRPNHGSASAS